MRATTFLSVDATEHGVKPIFTADVNKILESFSFIESFRNHRYNFLLFNFMHLGPRLTIFFYHLSNS